MKDRDALDAIGQVAQWFPLRSGGDRAFPPDGLPMLLDLIGDARLVLIGEATHGTDEFYSIRADCFGHFGSDPQSYGYAANLGLSRFCEDDVVAQLVELRSAAAEYARQDLTAAREWEQPAERRRVTPSIGGSYERLLHDTHLERFVLATSAARDPLVEARLDAPSA